MSDKNTENKSVLDQAERLGKEQAAQQKELNDIADDLKEMNAVVKIHEDEAKAVKEIPQPVHVFTSDVEISANISELAKDLVLAQAKMKGVEKTAENVFYTVGKKKAMYATLSDLIEASKPLHEHNLAVTQLLFARYQQDRDYVCVRTLLMHSTGQYISTVCSYPLPYENLTMATAMHETRMNIAREMKKFPSRPRLDVDQVGIITTYLRRYGLAGICDLAQTDSDGQDEQPSKPSTNDVETKKAAYHVQRLIQHNKVVAERLPEILAIREFIDAGDFGEASNLWDGFNQDDQRALWLATSKGGVFTTEQRQAIHSDDFKQRQIEALASDDLPAILDERPPLMDETPNNDSEDPK